MSSSKVSEKSSQSAEVMYEPHMPVDQLKFNDLNPRHTDLIPEEELKLDELCSSILEVGGIIVPLVVFPEDGKFVVLDGERRLRAAKKLKMLTVPVNIIPKRLTDSENLSRMFNIHMQREQWNTAARAVSLGRLKNLLPGISEEQIKTMAGMSDGEYDNALRILSFSSDLQNNAVTGELNPNYLVEMAKALENLNRYCPDLVKKYGRDHIIEKWVSKISRKVIRNNTHFRFVGRICRRLAYDKARNLIERLVEDDSYRFEQAWDEAEEEIVADWTDILESKCEKFTNDLRQLPIGRQSSAEMKEIKRILEKVLAEVQRKLKEIDKWKGT